MRHRTKWYAAITYQATILRNLGSVGSLHAIAAHHTALTRAEVFES